MRLIRVYQPVPLSLEAKIPLDDRNYHHLIHVLRLMSGHRIEIFNGIDLCSFLGQLLIEGKKAYFLIDKKIELQSLKLRSELKIHLIQSLAKGDKMDFIIQKAVELGVSEITPILSRYSDVRLESARMDKKITHWQNVLVHACEQCGRNELPQLNMIITWEQFFQNKKIKNHENSSEQLGSILFSEKKFILHPEFTKHTGAITETTINKVTLMVGPEGGFHEEEVVLAQTYGFECLVLGNRILRTETAGLAAIAYVQTKWGDFL